MHFYRPGGFGWQLSEIAYLALQIGTWRGGWPVLWVLILADLTAIDLSETKARNEALSQCRNVEQSTCYQQRIEGFLRMKSVIVYPHLKDDAKVRIAEIIARHTGERGVDWYYVDRENNGEQPMKGEYKRKPVATCRTKSTARSTRRYSESEVVTICN